MTGIIYEDGSINMLGPGNYVAFANDNIVEGIKGQGKRRYPYTRLGEALKLVVDDGEVLWFVVKQTNDELNIDTPIGRYLLIRNR